MLVVSRTERGPVARDGLLLNPPSRTDIRYLTVGAAGTRVRVGEAGGPSVTVESTGASFQAESVWWQRTSRSKRCRDVS